MTLAPALDKACKDLAKVSPYVVAAKSGTAFERGGFWLPFSHRRFFIAYPEVRVEEVGNPGQVFEPVQLILLHYLLTADGTPVADSWITYRYLPGGSFFERRFTNMAIGSLVRAFGANQEGFRRAALALGGTPMNRMGDAAFYFRALPHLPLACVLYLGDAEVGPSVNILFDASAPHYLPTEDLSYVGSYLSSVLRRYGREHPLTASEL